MSIESILSVFNPIKDKLGMHFMISNGKRTKTAEIGGFSLKMVEARGNHPRYILT
jgi:hypothetical protein